MNKIIGLVITALVSVIVLAAVLIPVINDATATEDTFKNEGWVHMKKYDTTAEITALWDHTKPNQITVNDVDIALPVGVPGTEFVLTACGSSNFLLRYSSTSSTTGAIIYNDGGVNYAASTADSSDMSITVSSGSITVDNGSGSTKTGTYTDYMFFVSDDTGAYVMKKPTVNAYLNDDSEVYGIGRTQVGTVTYSFVIVGDISDGWTGDIMQTTGPTLSDITGVYETVDSHLDLYSFDKITLTATLSGTDYPVTYNQVIVPYEITAEKAQHLSPAEIEILDILPVFIIIAVLIAAVSVVAFRRE